MGNKQEKVVQDTTSISQSLPPSTVLRQSIEDGLSLLPNEILFCIFDYLLPIDIFRAFEYDLQRYGELIKQHIVVHGFNLTQIKSDDLHLARICLSLISQQHLSICINDCHLSTVFKFVPSPKTLTVILNKPFEQSFLSTIQHESITCNKLILEYTSSCHRQMNDIDIVPLLSASVNTLILRNVIFLIDQLKSSYVLNSLHHIRCLLRSENDLQQLLIRLPMLISIDIRLISHDISEVSTALPVPKHFRIEYPYGTILNLSRFPPETRYYDQTVYSLPWFDTNSSLVLRSIDPKNYLNSFPHPMPYIRQLTIECTSEPWSFEFVIFLRQTFPNSRTLYTIQEYNTTKLVMTIITANDRKKGRCTLDQPYHETSIDWSSHPEAIRFLNIDRAYN